jgi:hypothetical protein
VFEGDVATNHHDTFANPVPSDLLTTEIMGKFPEISHVTSAAKMFISGEGGLSNFKILIHLKE